MSDLKVKLIGYPKNSQTITTAAALSCFKEKSTDRILKELLSLPKEKRLEKERAVLKNSFGKGHGSVGDLTHFTFSIENLSRVSTLFLCLPEYLEHLQQSLRRASADRGFYLPESIRESSRRRETEQTILKAFQFYENACENGIPAEDARFLLPLYTKTNITTTGNARELCHLLSMSKNPGTPTETYDLVKKLIELASEKTPYLFENFGSNYEVLSWYPSSQLFSSFDLTIQHLLEEVKNFCQFQQNNSSFLFLGSLTPFDDRLFNLKGAISTNNEAEMANLKHLHFEFLAGMSLACFHQATRQRTWNHSVESIYSAVEDALINPEKRIVIPPSIEKSGLNSTYYEIHSDLINLFFKLIDSGIEEEDAIGVIPHSLKIYDWVHINGWNAIHSIGKRTCLEAQWEIRRIAKKMAQAINLNCPAFKDFTKPQCITLGKCPEEKENCPYLNTA
jgi:thymidylate synthase (FAD)